MDQVGTAIDKYVAGRFPLLHDKLMRYLKTGKYQVQDFHIIACRPSFTIHELKRTEVPVGDDNERALVGKAVEVFGRNLRSCRAEQDNQYIEEWNV